MENSLQIAVLSHQSCSQNCRVFTLEISKIVVEIAVKIASVNRPLCLYNIYLFIYLCFVFFVFYSLCKNISSGIC